MHIHENWELNQSHGRLRNYRWHAFAAKMSYLCCIGLKSLIIWFNWQGKLRITLSRLACFWGIGDKKCWEKTNSKIWKIKWLTNVYSWPQYMLVSSGKDMIFLRDESICSKNQLFSIHEITRSRREVCSTICQPWVGYRVEQKRAKYLPTKITKTSNWD